MSAVSFARLSDAPPPARELLDIAEDGSWTAWRSIGAVIGRFAGDGAADIVALASAAGSTAPPSSGEFAPDATVDRVRVGQDGPRLQVAASAEPSGPWGDLLRSCRNQLDEALNHPVAAVALVVVDKDRLRLEHRGTGLLPLELGNAEVQATVWNEGAFVAAGSGRLEAGHVEAGPGWSIEVALDGIEPGVRGELVAYVTFVVDDGGVYIPVMLAAGRAPG